MIEAFIGVIEIVLTAAFIYYLVKFLTYKRRWGENHTLL